MSLITIQDDISIAAGAGDIWRRLADISSWGRWTRVVKHAAVYGPIKPGTEFKFDSGKWDFEGAIHAVEPGRSLALKARTIGLTLDSIWLFDSSDSNTSISVTITASGWIMRLFRSRVERGLRDSLFTWLYALKVSTERSSEGTGQSPGRPELKRPPRKPFTLPGLNIFFKGQRRSDEEQP